MFITSPSVVGGDDEALIDSVRLSLCFTSPSPTSLVLICFSAILILRTLLFLSLFSWLCVLLSSLSPALVSLSFFFYIPKPQLLKLIRPLVRDSVFLFSKRFPSACLSGRAEFGGHAEEASDPGAGGGGLRRHRPPAVQHQPRPGGCRTPRQVRRRIHRCSVKLGWGLFLSFTFFTHVRLFFFFEQK